MYVELIQAFEQFIRLSETDKQVVSTLFTERQYKKGDFFLKEGQVCREAGFIMNGLVRYFINNNGEEKVYGFGKEYNFVCNYESFLDHSASTKSIQFIEDSTLLVMSYNNLQLLYEQLPEGQKFGRLICEHLFVQAIRDITSLYTHQPEERYLLFLQTYPDLQQRVPQYYISSFVGVKPQSLSRIRKRLAQS